MDRFRSVIYVQLGVLFLYLYDIIASMAVARGNLNLIKFSVLSNGFQSSLPVGLLMNTIPWIHFIIFSMLLFPYGGARRLYGLALLGTWVGSLYATYTYHRVFVLGFDPITLQQGFLIANAILAASFVTMLVASYLMPRTNHYQHQVRLWSGAFPASYFVILGIQPLVMNSLILREISLVQLAVSLSVLSLVFVSILAVVFIKLVTTYADELYSGESASMAPAQ
ncbi:MAG: hypothetical protein ACXAE3_06160 [Candidatus Kariarchaeaceae archaeon]|jgi:hypothetical protein